jgi:hypothetical protein
VKNFAKIRRLEMRTITAALLVSTLVVSNAFAAPKAAAPLPAGKPAGVNEAVNLGPNAFLILVGVGIIAAGLAVTLSNNGGDGVTTPTTTSTSTTGLP